MNAPAHIAVYATPWAIGIMATMPRDWNGKPLPFPADAKLTPVCQAACIAINTPTAR